MVVRDNCHSREARPVVVVRVPGRVVPVGVTRTGVRTVVPVASQDDGAPVTPCTSFTLFWFLEAV